MHIDFKITTWDRAYIREEDRVIVLKAIKEGKLRNNSDFSNLEVEVDDWEKLTDVDEYMLPIENDGHSTLEVYDGDKDNMIYSNGK